MLLEIGMKVIHPLYPQWGEGTVLDLTKGMEGDQLLIQFEDRATPGFFSLENLQDQDGHSFSHLLPKPLSKKQLREEIKLQEEEAKRIRLEEATRMAVAFLADNLDLLELGIPLTKTEEQAYELETFYRTHAGAEITIEVKPARWGYEWCIFFPCELSITAPFKTIAAGHGIFRGPQHSGEPQALLLKDGRCRLCSTAVTLRLIEKGLRFKTT